jgi:DMSO/TMAO reductase YedYZ molybdopterin-dependent catalytic subunit
MAAAAAVLMQGTFSRIGFAEPEEGERVIHFLDQQPINAKTPMLKWEDLTDWITPDEHIFNVSHYGRPQDGLDNWKLQVTGKVDHPIALTLEQIKARPKKEIIATLECSGNGASPGFMGAIGNGRWTGTPLAGLLKECGVGADAVEVAFWGADRGKEKIRGSDYEQHFARSLSIPEASRPDVLLAYEMNGQPLGAGHGAPLRLVVPGWYGIAWVKWLTTIELRDHRLMNRFMARDYVTVRGIPTPDDSIEWRESSVGPMNVKSIVARVVQRRDGVYTVSGAAWGNGTPIKAVEIQIDGRPWMQTTLDAEHHAPWAWTFWSFDWKSPTAGEHKLVSRAINAHGTVQPDVEDPRIKYKKTYWEANAQYPRHVRIE